MIYTLTFNPSLDYLVSVKNLQLGMTNRTDSEAFVAGGKGINVSIVLHNLGIDSIALGFLAGFTGQEIEKQLKAKGIATDFIYSQQGNSRINIKITNVDGMEINASGPNITPHELAQLMQQLNQLQKGDILVLAGSIPVSLPKDIYQQIMVNLQNRGILFTVDASGELLSKVLPYKPFLIKPNHHELGELFHVKLSTRESVIPYGRKLQEQGAQNVLISLAGEGAVLLAADGTLYDTPAPKGQVVNAVGAGDSMVAGFLTGWLQQQDYMHAFRMSVAAGSASAFSDQLATKSEIGALYSLLQ